MALTCAASGYLNAFVICVIYLDNLFRIFNICLLFISFFFQFKCCGVDNYEDFNSSTDWDRTLGGKLSGPSAVITPIVCCKDLPSGSSTTDFACAQSPFTETKSNGKTVITSTSGR